MARHGGTTFRPSLSLYTLIFQNDLMFDVDLVLFLKVLRRWLGGRLGLQYGPKR